MEQRGWVTVAVILIVTIALLYITALSAMSSQEYTMALYSKQEIAAMYSAEAGMEVMKVYIEDAVASLNNQIQGIKEQREAQGSLLTKDNVYGIINNYMSNWCDTMSTNTVKNIYNYPGRYYIKELKYFDSLKSDYKVFRHVLFLQVIGIYGKSSTAYNGNIQFNVDDNTLLVSTKILMWGKVN